MSTNISKQKREENIKQIKNGGAVEVPKEHYGLYIIKTYKEFKKRRRKLI